MLRQISLLTLASYCFDQGSRGCSGKAHCFWKTSDSDVIISYFTYYNVLYCMQKQLNCLLSLFPCGSFTMTLSQNVVPESCSFSPHRRGVFFPVEAK